MTTKETCHAPHVHGSDLGGGYYFDTAICYTTIQREDPGSLYLLVLLFGWNALKSFWIGPVSLAQLFLVRAEETECPTSRRRRGGEERRQMSEAPSIL